MTTSPTHAAEQTAAPLQVLLPVSDERNLLSSQEDAGSCCGGSCHV